MNSVSVDLAPPDSSQHVSLDLLSHYENRLLEAQQALEMERRDWLLAVASANRELIAAQMDEDGLGLKLLACLRATSHLQASELAAAVGVPLDAIAPLLARLTRCGAVEVNQQRFSCASRGLELLHNLETATGIELTFSA